MNELLERLKKEVAEFGSSNITVTAMDLSELTGVDYSTASGLLKFLRAKGLAQPNGTRRDSGRKPSQLFKLPASITLDFLNS